MPSRRDTNQQQIDHDLIVVLNTKFDGMASDIKDLKDGTTSPTIDTRLDPALNDPAGGALFFTQL